MSTGLYRSLWRRFVGGGRSSDGRRAPRSGLGFKSALIGIAVIAILLVGAVGWLMMSVDDSESADGVAQVADEAPTDSAVAASQLAGATADQEPARSSRAMQANAALEPVPPDRPTGSIEPPAVNGLKIGSQSWRRGGLGSKALVTFTLRNDNPYAVKDVEIACAFSRSDGSHLTDRTRVIPGPVNMKSRKTFASLHVGFVNVNASKAKCTLVAAHKI